MLCSLSGSRRCGSLWKAGNPRSDRGAPPRERVLAILDGVLTWKLENRHLIRAREVAGAGLLQSAHYTWLHETIRALIQQAGHAVHDHAGYVAHVLLGALRADLLEELLAAGALPEEIRRAQAVVVHRLLNLTDQASNPVGD